MADLSKPEYNKKNCIKCPLFKMPYVPDKIGGSKILFVAEAPWTAEEIAQEPLIGKAGQIFRTVLNEADIPLNTISMSNTIHCRPSTPEGKIRKPNSIEKKCCSPILSSTIEQVTPEFIVTLGDVATKTFLGSRCGSITDIEGTVHKTNQGTIIPMFHPSYFQYVSYKLPEYRQAFKRLKHYVNGSTSCHIANTYKVDDGNNSLDWFKGELEKNNEYLTFDVETTAKDIFNEPVELLSVGLGNPDQSVLVAAWDKSNRLREYKELLENPLIPKVGHNLLFDLKVLKKVAGIDVKGRLHDTMIAHYLDTGQISGKFVSHKLKNIAKAYGIPIDQIKEVDYERMSAIDRNELYEYNKSDVVITSYLHSKIPKREFVYDFLCSTIPMFVSMELQGLTIDTAYLENILLPKYESLCYDTYNKVVDTVEDKAFNPASSKQIREYLKSQNVKLPQTAKGNDSVSAQTLSSITHPLGKKILDYRFCKKALSTYILPHLGKDKLHTNYGLTFTATGRITSNNVNILNIPRSREFRRMFIAPEGYKFVSIDFSSIEPRLMGIIAGETHLLKHDDIYAVMYEKVYKTLPNKEERQQFKSQLLGIMYGMHKPELLGIFYRAFPKIAKWMTNIKSYALKNKRIDIPYTHRWRDLRYEPLDNDKIKRYALNTPIQSIASDIVLNSCLEVYNADLDGVIMCNEIYDELNLYVRKDLIKEGILDHIASIMENSTEDIVSDSKGLLKTEVEYGDNWGDMEIYERIAEKY